MHIPIYKKSSIRILEIRVVTLSSVLSARAPFLAYMTSPRVHTCNVRLLSAPDDSTYTLIYLFAMRLLHYVRVVPA